MAEQRVERRLVAILAGDVAGYSRLMGADEEGTLLRLNAHRREFLEPKIADHRGRIVKRTGDGVLIEFASAVDATRCALEIQRGMMERNAAVPQNKRIELRIGIHVGDVIIEDSDIFGDGVNIAARLEGIAQPGGIIISDDAYRQVRGKLDASFKDAGERELKNIARPVRVYQVQKPGRAMDAPVLALPDKPSIAVLPFQNLSGDPEQEYFADGMVEEIITALSRMRWLFVIARNSSFTYKGRAVDVKQVGHELGVRYVLEGSVRKADTRVRITGQLIDAVTGAHLWAERFDGTLQDIFELQDHVATSVAGAIAPKLEQAETERAKRKPTENLNAYDCYLRGMESYYHWTQEATTEALRHFERAIEIDTEFATAYAMAANCYRVRKINNWVIDRDSEIDRMMQLARRATRLGKDDAVVLYLSGHVLAQVGGDLAMGAAMIDRALTLDPNLARAWLFSGWVRIWLGEPEMAIEHMERALRLSPLDPLLYSIQNGIAAAHFLAGRYDIAASWAEKSLREQPDYLQASRVAAASRALAGQLIEARTHMARVLQIDPTLRVSCVKDMIPFRGSEDAARYVDGLRKAGLPE